MAATKKAETATEIRISPPNMRVAAFSIVGTAPLMVHKFWKKSEIMLTQSEGSTARSRRKRDARDYEREVEAAAYTTADGWHGVNAAAFRNAAISACRLVGAKMTLAKLSIFIEADGYDEEEGTPLVRIEGEMQASVMPARNQTGVMDIRARPMWAPGWRASVRIRWDADQFSLTDVTNLLARVGAQVGIGEGRPDSRESAGLGFGLFAVDTVAELR